MPDELRSQIEPIHEIIRKMGRADPEKRYLRWHECVLDLMLAERGRPPLAAQLSEALAPHRRPPDEGDTGSTRASIPRTTSSSQPSTESLTWRR